MENSRSKRLQALDKAYQPTPKTKRMVLRSHFTRSSRATKLSPKASPTVNAGHGFSQNVTTSHAALMSRKVSALNSPERRELNRSRKLQMTASASSSLNQSLISKSPVSHSLLHSPTRPTTQAFLFPSFPTTKEDPDFPLTPAQVLKRFSRDLTMQEQGEILEYKQIYFYGKGAAKVSASPVLPNNGYDDERADYRVVAGDHIAYRYEITDILGKGSFGVVLHCFDHKRKEPVAVKIIRNKHKFHQQGLIEVKALECLRANDPDDHLGIVRMKTFFLFRCHICISFELLSINLYELMKINGFKGVSEPLIRRFAVQMLISLLYIRKNGIIHCDLKPENILLVTHNKSAIKIIDFGSCCWEHERVYTYIQSRFYRAPEIILGIPYTTAIDMWSLGCIVAELSRGYPLFPGENETEQLQYMMETLGVPPKAVVRSGSRWEHFFEISGEPKLAQNSRGEVHFPGTKKLKTSIASQETSFCDFVGKCLDWDPRTRMTPEEGLRHEWLLEVGRGAIGLQDTQKSKHPIRVRRHLSKASN